VKLALVGTAVILLIQSLPDIRRYLEMSRM
jgi:hypothetical protein